MILVDANRPLADRDLQQLRTLARIFHPPFEGGWDGWLGSWCVMFWR